LEWSVKVDEERFEFFGKPDRWEEEVTWRVDAS
jgi:hypothetical protein